MSTAAFYAVNESEVSFRALDGEAVIINSTTGYYYSLNRSGTVLWNLLAEGGRPAAAAAESLAAYYGADAAAVWRDVETLLAVLLAENLVAEVAATQTGANGAGLPPTPPQHPYEPPQLTKFDQLQRLMICGE